jgi:beta-glucosidase
MPHLAHRATDTLAAMTLQEKALIVEGRDSWFTHPIPRLGIPSITVTDGPHGVRLVSDIGGGFDVLRNARSTAFPTSVTVASSWDPELARRMGVAIAHECIAAGVQVLLGPGINLQRSPRCGRNFEYFSEDPLLTAAFGTAFISGVQSQGVGTSLKHFAANSNEEFRYVGDSLVDERALRELYLRAFERIVKDAAPTTVMCAYNRVNGIFASEHRELLTGILREEWGFDGLVMTDWGATADRVAGIAAGCDLDMPGGVEHNRASIIAAVESGRLPVAELDLAVRRVLELIERTADPAPVNEIDEPSHAELSAHIAAESAVLLRNDGILPLPLPERTDPAAPQLLVVGDLFDRMRFQGAGSSLITPTSLVTPRDAFEARGVRVKFERGYDAMAEAAGAGLAAAAVAAVTPGEPVLFFGGLTDFDESEGFDREHLRLADAQIALLRSLIDAGGRVVLVLFAGAPVQVPFADELAAVLDMLLPGQHGGDATAALLFGESAPSGRLTQTWWRTVEASSAAADFNRGIQARYVESVYVGYRFVDSERPGSVASVQYPFGFGLSTTVFEYRDVQLRVEAGTVHVEVTVHNVGERDGAEVVQVYASRRPGAVFMPEQELRAFSKVRVAAGGSERVAMEFPIADLAYWDVADHDWRLENGEVEVRVGASSADIRCRASFAVDSGAPSRSPYPSDVDRDYAAPPTGVPESFPALLGRPVVPEIAPRRLALESRFIDARRSVLGRIIDGAIVGRMRREYRQALAMPESIERSARVTNAHFLVRMMPYTSPRSLAQSSNGEFPYSLAVGLDLIASGHPVRGILTIMGRRPPSA